jgi:acyl-coenzyme A thioesterase PaaI-like protein
LTPFTVQETDLQTGTVTVLFEAQPAFSNHFQNVQGGFVAAMLDCVISVAAFAATGRWLPMASLSISFLRPVPVAPCLGQAKILKIGKRLCFVEGRLTAGGTSLITAQAALANDNP